MQLALAMPAGITSGKSGSFRLSSNNVFLLTIAALFAVSLLMTGMIHAQTSTTIFQAMFYKAQDFFYNIRYLSLLVGAIGVIAIAVGAYAGRFPAQKAIVFAVAIIMIASSGMIVSYFATGGTVAGGAPLSTTSSGVTQSQVASQYYTDTEGTAGN